MSAKYGNHERPGVPGAPEIHEKERREGRMKGEGEKRRWGDAGSNPPSPPAWIAKNFQDLDGI